MLRNLSKGKDIGAGGKLPSDFILWLVEGSTQKIAFVDPKGILRLQGLDDPKIMFHKKIKELETRLGDSSVSMSSFIISNTPLEAVRWWTDNADGKIEFAKRNVFFKKKTRMLREEYS